VNATHALWLAHAGGIIRLSNTTTSVTTLETRRRSLSSGVMYVGEDTTVYR